MSVHFHPLEITQPLWSDWCKGSVQVKSPSSLLTCNSCYACTRQELRIKNLLYPISSRIRARHGCSNMRKKSMLSHKLSLISLCSLKAIVYVISAYKSWLWEVGFHCNRAYIDWSLSAGRQAWVGGGHMHTLPATRRKCDRNTRRAPRQAKLNSSPPSHFSYSFHI